MPELPEVETIRRQLEKLIVGQTISSIEVLNPGSFRAKKDGLIGRSVAGVGRHGKVLILDLKRSDLGVRQGQTLKDTRRFFVHLKMSGQLEFLKGVKRSNFAAARLDLKKFNRSKHLRVAIGFTDNSRLLFYDQRKFGWITDDPAVLPRGIDALDPALSPQPKAGRPLAENKLAEILASSNRPVKTILLDQSKIAGIGNIYASEILWQAGISPFRKGVSLLKQGDSLSEISEKFRKLLTAIREVLTDAIDSGGSTMDDQLYRHVSGQTGNYWSRRRVYDRAGELCLRPACRLPAGRHGKAGALIQKIVIGRRSTYFCPNCQT